MIGILVTLAVLLPTTSAAAAKTDRMYPVAESYAPGDTATMIGYVKKANPGESRALFIEPLPHDGASHPAGAAPIEVGTLEVSQTANKGRHRYRVFAEFVVPVDLEPGVYMVMYDSEAGMIGQLGASKLRVGTEPNRPIRRDWALNEPAILGLELGALISVPGGTVTAADIMNGSYFANRAGTSTQTVRTRRLGFEAASAEMPLATFGVGITPVEISDGALFQATRGIDWWVIVALPLSGLLIVGGVALVIHRRKLDSAT